MGGASRIREASDQGARKEETDRLPRQVIRTKGHAMKLRIFLGFVFFVICVLALGRILVQAARRPFRPQLRPTRPAPSVPAFAR